VAGRVEDGSGAAAGGDRLRLSKPAEGGAATTGRAGSAGSGGAAVGRNSTAELGVARDAAMKEAMSRIADLEKNVSDLQKLLELKNKSLSDTQKQLDEARAASKAVTGQVTAPVAVEPPKPEAPKLEAPKPDLPKPEVAAVEPPKAEAPAPVAAPAPAVEPAKPETAEPAKAETSEPVKEPVPVPAAPVAETGFFDDLLDSPFLLPGLGGIAAVAAGYGLYAMRRRRKVEKFEDSLIAADAFNSNSLFGSSGGQSVDTSNSVFNAGSSTAAVDVASTEVDPIAEADVYIAYGREAQAEDILKEALRRQPERQAIRKKLLEIYAGRRDVKAFEGVAGDMYAMTAGANDEWPQVVTMGLAIDPTNALYGGGADAVVESSFEGTEAAMDRELSAKEIDALEIDDFSEPDSQPFSNVVEQAFGTPADTEADLRGLDFDLNIDTQTNAAESTGEAPFGAATEIAAQDLPSLEDQFDLPSLDLPELESKPAVASFDAPELDLDLSDLESLTKPVTLTADSDTALDLSDVSLELEPELVAQEANDESSAGRWQEMATKLDLASAYEEIGDKEGARELLQEVIQGGDGGQQQKARAMLSKIA
jgi:pilus assembly protein FimV